MSGARQGMSRARFVYILIIMGAVSHLGPLVKIVKNHDIKKYLQTNSRLSSNGNVQKIGIASLSKTRPSTLPSPQRFDYRTV